MAGRIPLAALSLVLAASLASAGTLLASYDFETPSRLVSGPDTFAVFQHARGSVRLAEEYRWSGLRSLELRDAVGDGDFPELQGYFPALVRGRLDLHFAFLLATVDEETNVALAGPAGFQPTKDGLAFRLQMDGGWLRHHSDGIPRKLFRPEPFTWYVVDVAYRPAEASYDLRIVREGDTTPVVDLRAQRSAAGIAGSTVDKFSFVGDPFRDRSKTVFYLDDVVVGTDGVVARHPFVAPGRRKLFVEQLVAAGDGPFDELIAAKRYGEARDLAIGKGWPERAGDACLLAREVREAESHYKAALLLEPDSPSLLLKLADVAFLDGDARTERALRERIYGRIRR